ncbi:MAG: biopolymer transporter ExbD [Planctomycetes bacterium]|nr:biopolymer transporter ExbD [Planctomycetota bacterium]
MSHGGSEETAEPNLMSLLDLVLQLLMFFLIVANFVEEQNNRDIKLPEATTAVPIDKEENEILALFVAENGELITVDEGNFDDRTQIEGYVDRVYKARVRNFGQEAVDKMSVVVKGDNRAEFEHIYRVMLAAKKAKFNKIELRANLPGGK